MTLAVVIPALNEARTIRAVAECALRESSLVIVVDDGSTDETCQALAGLAVILVRHDCNRGKAAALWTGFDVAMARGAAYIATVDGDGQHDPVDLRRLAAEASKHPRSIIIGARLLDRQRAPGARRFANAVADFWISWAAGYRIADSQSGERVYPAELVRLIESAHDRRSSFTFESEVLIRSASIGYDSVSVPIRTIYLGRGGRRSHFRPTRDIARIVIMVARSLLERGLYLNGLWNSLRSSAHVVAPDDVDAAAPILR